MTRKARSTAPAVCAGVLAFAASAFAGLRTLPTPPQSEFADAESSAVVALPVNEGRHIRLTVAFDPSPTNAVQVAFGNDANGDEDLGPEETDLVVGCDCGVVQVKVEGEGEQRNLLSYSAGQPEQEPTHHCSPSPLTFTLKQPKAVCWNLAKVTTHNLTSTNLVVTLSRVGTTIFVR